MSKFAAGAVGIVLIVLFSYGAYTKFANPFANPYTVKAVFANANGLQNGSLVRIAGVNVGTVTGVSTEPGCHSAARDPKACNAAEVTMTIQNNGLPLHNDATFAIRPRIFLEGNFFVDISPGTPNAPVAGDGHTFPIQQGVEPVQFDQVLTGLQADTRQNLQILLQQYGHAVKVGGPAFNRSIQYWLPAYEYSSIVAHDFLGTQTHDLSRYIAAQGEVAGAINTHPEQLKSLVTDFNTTANAFAREQASLRETVVQLPRTLSTAIPAFNALNAAFPPLRRFATRAHPGREVDAVHGRQEPALHHPAAAARPALGARGPDPGSEAHDSRSGQAHRRDHPAHEEPGPALRQLRGQRHLPVVTAHAQ